MSSNGHAKGSGSPSNSACSEDKVGHSPADIATGKESVSGTSDPGDQKLTDHICCQRKIQVAAQPIDWKPQDKCSFCEEGKLFAVNDRGELVPEVGSGSTGPDPSNTVSQWE